MDLNQIASLISGGGSAAGILGGAGAAAATGGLSLALPIAEGIGQTIAGVVKSRQAKKLKDQLDTPDPRMSQFMDEINRQRRSFETGSAYGQEMKELKNQESATQMGVIRAARGNTGSALQAIEQVGLNTGIGYGKIAAAGEERQDKYTQMYGDLVSRMEQRKYEENAYEYQQKSADARQSKLTGLQTILNAGSLGKGGTGGGGGAGGLDIQSILKKLLQQGGGGGASGIFDLPDKNSATATA